MSTGSPKMLKQVKRREYIPMNSRHVANAQAIQMSPGLQQQQQSSRQKKELAKYYTSLLGSQEQPSVQAYMQVSSEQAPKKRKVLRKKKRATSVVAKKEPVLKGIDSQKNMLTIENDGALPDAGN